MPITFLMYCEFKISDEVKVTRGIILPLFVNLNFLHSLYGYKYPSEIPHVVPDSNQCVWV